MPDLWRQDVIGAREIGGAGVVPLGGEINHNVAAGAETFEIVKPSGAKYLVVRGESGVHRIKPGKLDAQTFTDGDVDVGNDTITITDHGYETGDGPLQLSNSGGALPGGLAADTDYWVVKIDDNTIALAASPGDANRIALTAEIELEDPEGEEEDAIRVNITSAAGAGTHSIGGDQGDGIAVGFDQNLAAIPASSTSATVRGSHPLLTNEIILFSGRVLTVRALASGDVLTWYVVD